MLRRSVVILAMLAGISLAEVRIRPPSPYMSSPPPPVDTTPLDPNRKPTCEIVPAGTTEQWYGDWNLVSDKSVSGPIQVTAPRKGAITFHASFDNRGWITELTYYDARRKERWTKLFTYPPRIPAGPGEVPVSIVWSKADGSLIDLKAVEASLAKPVPSGARKINILDAYGEPFLVIPESDRGETWVYATAKEERRFRFDKRDRLMDAPATAPAAVPAAPAAPAAVPEAPAAAETPAAPAAPAAPADSTAK